MDDLLAYAGADPTPEETTASTTNTNFNSSFAPSKAKASPSGRDTACTNPTHKFPPKRAFRFSIYAKRAAASPSQNLRKLMAEGTVDAHLNSVLRLVVSRSLLLVSVRKDHELDRYLLEKKKQEFLAKKRKRGSADDPICQQFGVLTRQFHKFLQK